MLVLLLKTPATQTAWVAQVQEGQRSRLLSHAVLPSAGPDGGLPCAPRVQMLPALPQAQKMPTLKLLDQQQGS